MQYHGIEGVTGRFLGWWAVMTQAAFSFIVSASFYFIGTITYRLVSLQGTEIVAVR